MDVSDVVHEELLFIWEWVIGETNSRWQQERGPWLSPSHWMTRRRNPGEFQEWRAPLLDHSIRMTQSEWPLNQYGVTGRCSHLVNKGIDQRENKATAVPEQNPDRHTWSLSKRGEVIPSNSQPKATNGADHSLTVSYKKMVSIIVSIFKVRKLGWGHLVSS